MPHFSGPSLKHFETLHPDLQRILSEAINQADFAIICGHRDEIDQTKAFLSGKSKLQWPHSRHNSTPSEAVDIVPFPVNWEDEAAFKKLAELLQAVALHHGIRLTWGGEWKMRDLVHFELTPLTRAA